MYHIVVFIQSEEVEVDEVEIIHDNWLSSDKKVCFYPPFLSFKTSKVLRNGVRPDESWKKYPVRLLHSYDTYEEARKKLPRAEITSNLDTDTDASPVKFSGRNLRRRALDASMDSDIEEIAVSKSKKSKTLPLPPAVIQASQSGGPQTSLNVEAPASQSAGAQVSQSAATDLYIDQDGFVIYDQISNSLSEPAFRSPLNRQTFCSPPPAMPMSDTPRRVFHQDPSVYQLSEHQQYDFSPENPVGPLSAPVVEEYLHPRPASSKLKLTPVEREMFRWMENINYTLKEQSRLLANVLASTSSSSGDPCDYDFPALPIKNDDDMQQWEKYLSTATNFSKAVKFFSVKGGNDVSSVTRRVMKTIMTTELASCYNWAGRGGKKPFKDLVTRRLITCAVRENKNAKIASEKDVEDAMKNWLKYCPLRLKYDKKE